VDIYIIRGSLVNFGNASGDIGQFVTKELHASCRAVLGFSLGTTRNNRPELLRETAARIMDYLAEGRLDISAFQLRMYQKHTV